jgi:dynein intermediate chain 2
VTEAEKSHYDAVFDVVWPGSKTGAECISAAPDGRVLWWDWRNLQQGPITSAFLTDGLPGDRVVGATRLDNSTEQPMKVLVGTEQGYVYQIIRKGAEGTISNRFGAEGGKHHGPIFAIQRNPAQNLSKYFMTIGDWTAKMWADDLKVPLITTRYHDAYLTDGCWSSTRPGIFFLTRSDGWIDIWDYYYRQNEICFSQKISDYSLTCMAVKPKTSDILIGDASGSVTLLQLCKSLWEPQPKGVEEGALKIMFEREGSREKTLLQQKKMLETRRAKELKKEVKKEVKKKNVAEEKIKELEADFFDTLKKYQEKLELGVMEASGVFKEEEKKEEKKEEVPVEEKKEVVSAEVKHEEPPAEGEEKREGEEEVRPEGEAKDEGKVQEDEKEAIPESKDQPEESKKEEVPANIEEEGDTKLHAALGEDLHEFYEEEAKKEDEKQEEPQEESKQEVEKHEVQESSKQEAEEKKDEEEEEEEDAKLGDDAQLALVDDAVDDLKEHEDD